MAHSRTAKKAVRQNVKRRARNKAAFSQMRTQIKKLRDAISANDSAAVATELPQAHKLLDKAAKSNRIHANKAARLKSQLSKAANQATSG